MEDRSATDWLEESIRPASSSVIAYLPDVFEAYARIYHPLIPTAKTGESLSWSRYLGDRGKELDDLDAIAEVARDGFVGWQTTTGLLDRDIITSLVRHLRVETTTPSDCYFAVWEGVGGLPYGSSWNPTLVFPHRRYHVFEGSLDAAVINFRPGSIGHLSPNLWWPADHAWCIATEVDLPWTYLGGSLSCVDAVATDESMEVARTSVSDPW